MAELKSSGLSAQEDIEALSPRDDSQVQYDIKGDSSDGGDAEGEAKPHPMQKRRRVTRACDECRRKKIKCDGKQPCTHCTVYSYGEDPPFGKPDNADMVKNVPMISHQIDGEILLPSILKLLSNDCRRQSPY